MKNRRTYRSFLLIPVLLLIAADTPNSAVTKVRQGLQHFRSREYAEAETAFSEAGEISPENALIVFDHACAALANGDPDQARRLFRKAASGRSADVSVDARYNLGCLEADAARQLLGDEPEAAEGETREQAVELLLTSVRHYRDVLRIRPEHNQARHNLELIRLYIKHIQSQWAERDKQKARDEKDLLQFLKMIEEQETEIRRITKVLDAEDNSVQRRQAIGELADRQRVLQEEIEPLQDKIREQFQAAAQNGSPQAPDSGNNDQAKQAEELLLKLAEDAGTAMLTAADALQKNDPQAAVASETESLDVINQLYIAVAPYQDLLQRALQQQQKLVPSEEESSTSESEQSPKEDPTIDDAQEDPEPPAETVSSAVDEQRDFESLAEQQSRITDWSGVLSLKAEQALPQMRQQRDALKATVESSSTEADDAKRPSDVNDSNRASDKQNQDDRKDADTELSEEEKARQAQQEQMKQQLAQIDGLVQSMELAVKLGPDAAQHSQSAWDSLLKKDSAAAEPEQAETLRILKEIAEPLPKQPPQNQDDRNQNQDGENDDQNQQDNQNQDQQSQDQNESSENDQQNQDSQENDQQQENKQQPQDDIDRQKAESVLRQARERERKHKELQKQLRALLGQRIKVDKDW